MVFPDTGPDNNPQTNSYAGFSASQQSAANGGASGSRARDDIRPAPPTTPMPTLEEGGWDPLNTFGASQAAAERRAQANNPTPPGPANPPASSITDDTVEFRPTYPPREKTPEAFRRSRHWRLGLLAVGALATLGMFAAGLPGVLAAGSWAAAGTGVGGVALPLTAGAVKTAFSQWTVAVVGSALATRLGSKIPWVRKWLEASDKKAHARHRDRLGLSPYPEATQEPDREPTRDPEPTLDDLAARRAERNRLSRAIQTGRQPISNDKQFLPVVCKVGNDYVDITSSLLIGNSVEAADAADALVMRTFQNPESRVDAARKSAVRESLRIGTLFHGALLRAGGKTFAFRRYPKALLVSQDDLRTALSSPVDLGNGRQGSLGERLARHMGRVGLLKFDPAANYRLHADSTPIVEQLERLFGRDAATSFTAHARAALLEYLPNRRALINDLEEQRRALDDEIAGLQGNVPGNFPPPSPTSSGNGIDTGLS